MFKLLLQTFFTTLLLTSTLFARDINIDNLVNQATKENKNLYLFLHKTDCGYCENMREFTLENGIIMEFTKKNFIYEHINIYEKDSVVYGDFQGSGREFAKYVNADFYPSTLFFDAKSNIIHTEIGFRDNEKEPNENRFLTILNFIKSKSHENMDFEDYKFEITEEL